MIPQLDIARAGASPADAPWIDGAGARPTSRTVKFVLFGLALSAAAILFATRPDARAEIAEDAGKPSAAAAPKLAEGSLLCTIRPDRSRITVSSATDVPITIRAGGCVNGRTQYTRGADDRWQRILVPNEEATVTVASIDATGRDYRVERYLLDAETMARAREIRAGSTLQGCTVDPEQLAGLAAQQDAIRSALPPTPNERLVYRCQRASGAAIKDAESGN